LIVVYLVTTELLDNQIGMIHPSFQQIGQIALAQPLVLILPPSLYDSSILSFNHAILSPHGILSPGIAAVESKVSSIACSRLGIDTGLLRKADDWPIFGIDSNFLNAEDNAPDDSAYRKQL
jgi:hypothetical protein